MRGLLAVIFFTALTAICWGVYGPVLKWGHDAMDHSSLRPFVCVGLAYMLIAVIVPGALLRIRGEAGAWTATGLIWSFAAGAAGAIGALGIIMALSFHGSPIYVMPLVFGGAPVVNTFVTMYLGKSYRQAGPIFYAGLILVITGAATVLVFKPAPPAAAKVQDLSLSNLVWIGCSIATAAFAWGAYGPVLHKGQSAMQGSRLRPLICVGLAYFLIAVIVPGLLLELKLMPSESHGEFTTTGSLWSLAGGAAGAIGALGIIMAFTFGGKPVYVMPLVFGIAPVINTFVSMISAGTWSQADPIFFAGLLLVIAGAVTVLIFAPKSTPHGAAAAASLRPA
jgi:hypothetical protein